MQRFPRFSTLCSTKKTTMRGFMTIIWIANGKTSCRIKHSDLITSTVLFAIKFLDCPFFLFAAYHLSRCQILPKGIGNRDGRSGRQSSGCGCHESTLSAATTLTTPASSLRCHCRLPKSWHGALCTTQSSGSCTAELGAVPPNVNR